MIESVWTDERVAELTRRHRAGESFETIARGMALTKNQVVGKAHRLGLEVRPSPFKGAAPGTRAPSTRAPRIPIEGPIGCRWPMWGDEPPTHQYCNAEPNAPGEPYCRHHRAQAWVIPPRKPVTPQVSRLTGKVYGGVGRHKARA